MSFDQLVKTLFEEPTILTRFIETVALLLLLGIIRRLLLIRVNRTLEDPGKIYAWRKGSQYVVLFVAVVTISALWFDGFDNATTYLGLLSAGIAIALQDPLINIVGWIYILTHPQFQRDRPLQMGGVSKCKSSPQC